MAGIENAKSTLDFLGTLGDKDAGDKVVLSNVAKALVALSEHLIAQATRNLQKKGNVATGQTATSIVAGPLQTNATRMQIDIEILSTYKFLDKGVKGVDGRGKGKYRFKTKRVSKKMATAILKWLRKRSVVSKYKPHSSDQDKLRGKDKGSVERKNQRIRKMVRSSNDLKGLAYAVSAGIKMGGIEPSYFFTNAVKDTAKLQKQKYAQALKLDIIEALN